MALTQYFVAMSIDGYIADPEEQLDWLSPFGNLDGKRRRYERFFEQVGASAMGARSYEFIRRHDAPWYYGDRPTWVFTHRDLPRHDGANLRFTGADVSEVHPALVEAAGGVVPHVAVRRPRPRRLTRPALDLPRVGDHGQSGELRARSERPVRTVRQGGGAGYGLDHHFAVGPGITLRWLAQLDGYRTDSWVGWSP